MRVVTADEIDALLDFPALIAALRTAFAGGMAAPERHHHTMARPGASNATHLLMPAWTIGAGEAYLGTKIVNVFPDNGARGLPAVHGLYVLQSGLTGAPIAAMDGTRLTAWRTAAASALAATFLARADSERLLMVGAGALAPFLIRAHCAARPITRIEVWNRRRAGAEALAASLRAAGLNVEAVVDLSAAVSRADVISCATLSQEPMIEGAWLRPGQHVDLVGAFTMSMREADDQALRRARVFVDTDAALNEGGDVAGALQSGAIGHEHVLADLHALCTGAPGRRGPDEITLFKSVGAAIEDLAAAILVMRAL